MRCLYCGKELALFKRLRGGEFCSDAHRQKYQEEYTQLALNRLLQANAPKEGEKGESGTKDAPEQTPREAESPALKRRERFGRDPVSPEVGAGRPLPEPLKPSFAPVAETPAPVAPAPAAIPQTAVLEPEPAPAASSEPVEVRPEAGVPAPAPMASFLVECPLPPELEPPAAVHSTEPLVVAGAPALPRLQAFPPDPDAAHLDPAERVALFLFTVTDFQTPPRERGLELREFVRGIPQVEIQVKPAVESGFEPVKEPFEVTLETLPPQDPPALWLASELDLAVADADVALGDLARLDFALTGWGGEGAEPIHAEALAGRSPAEPEAEPSAEAQAEPSAEAQAEPAGPATAEPAGEPPEMSMRLEPMRLEPAQHEAASPASPLPEPVHFEPVHIDPVFMEKLAGGPGIEAAPDEEPIAPEIVPAAVEESTVQDSAAPTEDSSAPLAEQPAPASITRPVPVTLHGLAPMRGKPVQVFATAILRMGDLQIPRETSLPLRPLMVLGPAPKPATDSAVEQPATAGKSIPIPAKKEPAKADASKPESTPRKAEVRVLPVQVREVKAEPVKSETPKPEPREGAKVKETPVPAKTAPAPKAEPVKPEPAAALAAKPAEAPKPVEASKPVPPSQELDSLGLPKLTFQQNESFWSKLPGVVKAGVIAAVLALVIGGVILTSRGSSSVKPAAVVSNEPVLVEEAALGNTAGWEQDWFADRPGAKQGRHVDVLRGSLGLRDYRLVFEGQIEHAALGWVFRADNKSFYVEKIQVVTPGHDPVVDLERFAVVNGVEQQRTRVALTLQAHLDTLYKVRMDAVGDRFTTWVQDQQVDQWSDSQFPVGGVGLYYDAGDSFKLSDTLNVIPLRKK